MGAIEAWKAETETRSQNLLGAIDALRKEGFAITKAEAVGPADLEIHCAYLGKESSPKSEPVTM
jgi:hypothetical protein